MRRPKQGKRFLLDPGRIAAVWRLSSSRPYTEEVSHAQRKIVREYVFTVLLICVSSLVHLAWVRYGIAPMMVLFVTALYRIKYLKAS